MRRCNALRCIVAKLIFRAHFAQLAASSSLINNNHERYRGQHQQQRRRPRRRLHRRRRRRELLHPAAPSALARHAAGIRRNLNKLPDPAEVTGTINYRPPDVPPAPLPGVGGRIGDSLVDYPDNEEDLGDDDEHAPPLLGIAEEEESGGDGDDLVPV